MATVVSNQPAQTSDNGMGFLLGVILLIVAAVLFFMYGLPAISGGMSRGAQVNVPSQVDVNMHK